MYRATIQLSHQQDCLAQVGRSQYRLRQRVSGPRRFGTRYMKMHSPVASGVLNLCYYIMIKASNWIHQAIDSSKIRVVRG